MIDIKGLGFKIVTDFGAIGDGKTDCSSAIQKAIDAAAGTGGGVWFPPGKYACASLRVPSHVGLFAAPSWSYLYDGGTTLVLNNPDAEYLIDVTEAYGARLHGLALNGAGLGADVCAVFSGERPKGKREDTLCVEHCRISRFTGDAVHLKYAFTFTLQKNMIIFNKGNGFRFQQWDGWIRDNIFNNNEGYGIYGRPWNGAVTVAGNRVEWNRKGGIRFSRGSHHHICNNYIDRSGGPGITIDGGEPEDRAYGRAEAHAITGNIIHRSGANVDPDSHECCHLYLEFQHGITVTGNTMTSARNDNPDEGNLSPSCGIVYGGLRNCVIGDNVWPDGVTKAFLLDIGDNDESVIFRDNPGCVRL